MCAMLRDVVVVFRRWAHAPAIHAASHVDHAKKSCMFFFYYFYTCMRFCSYSYGAPLNGTSGRRSSALNI